MNAPTLFDGLEEGRQRRDLGIKRVVMASHLEPWYANAWRAILGLVAYGAPFTCEAVRDYAGDPPKPNTMGSVFNHAAEQGLIEWAGDQVQSGRPEAHGRWLKVWKPTRQKGSA